MSSEPTVIEVGHSLAVFGNYRVLRSQQLAEDTFLHPSILMALGLRETGLTNICGGAKLVNGVWVQAFTDRGCFQISDQVPANAKWLASVPGCNNGSWSPQAGFTAFSTLHCPRFSDAVVYVLKEFEENKSQAALAGVRANDLVRFCVAAHNAGFEGALEGYRAGNVDQNTAHGDYSAWVLKYATIIHNWVVEHPNWVYHGQTLGENMAEGSIPVTDDPAIQSAAGDVGTSVPGIISDIKGGNIASGVVAGENLYGQLAPLANTITQEAKAGYKTTEFYLVLAYEALTQSGAIHLPGTWGKAAAGIAGVVAYALSRGLAKSGVGNQVQV